MLLLRGVGGFSPGVRWASLLFGWRWLIFVGLGSFSCGDDECTFEHALFRDPRWRGVCAALLVLLIFFEGSSPLPRGTWVGTGPGPGEGYGLPSSDFRGGLRPVVGRFT